MRLVERHIIKKGHKYFDECDRVTRLSKELYNSANYYVRQLFIKEEGYSNYFKVNRHCTSTKQENYYNLPSKVSKETLRQLDKNWISFFKSIKDFKKTPSKYLGRPKLPKYKKGSKFTDNRFKASYTYESISKKEFRKGLINPSQTNIHIPTKIKDFNSLCGVRVVVKYGFYIIEVVYEKTEIKLKKDNKRYASIDIGLNNLACVSFNDKSLNPYIINGKPLKSINQYFNKKKSILQSYLGGKKHTSNKIEKLTQKRTRKVDDYLHKTSRYIVNHLVSNNINTLILGKNDGWKQDINIGKRNNQNFVNIPFTRFINLLEYKCELEGLRVLLKEESYTSKCSFLDQEPIKKHTTYKGKRIKRGLFKSNKGLIINADLNGSLNIMKKAIPKAFTDGIEGVSVHPTRIQSFL